MISAKVRGKAHGRQRCLRITFIGNLMRMTTTCDRATPSPVKASPLLKYVLATWVGIQLLDCQFGKQFGLVGISSHL